MIYEKVTERTATDQELVIAEIGFKLEAGGEANVNSTYQVQVNST